jgi:integrase
LDQRRSPPCFFHRQAFEQSTDLMSRATRTARRSQCAACRGVIAEQLGHADTPMTEKHYTHLAPSYVADTIRAHFPVLGIAGETSVAPMQRKA